MARYLVGKFGRAVISLIVVTLVVFILSRASGDPVRLMVPADASPADIAAIKKSLGLDQPYVVQYWKFLSGLLHFDLGTSVRYNAPVGGLILDRLGATLELALVALVFAVVVSVPIGVLAAHKPSGWANRIAKGGALAGQSIPTFVVGTVLVLAFAVNWQIFPASNKEGLSSFILPAVTLGWFAIAAITRITYSSMRDALDSPYVEAARSKGLPEWSILFRHALRNAATAVLTITALQLVLFANGAIVVETIFNWPGIGQLTVQSAFARDFPMIQGLVVFTATITIIVNLLTDAGYALIDRRIKSDVAA